MKRTDKHEKLVQENRRLRAQFEAAGLCPDDLGPPAGERLEVENQWLREVTAWVLAYCECPDRGQLEQRGLLYPPIEPGLGPNEDWLRFERWVRGQPIWWRYAEDFGPLRPSDDLNDDEIEREVDRIADRLAERGVIVDLQKGVPARLAYGYLEKELAETRFEFCGPGAFCVLNGCGGYCPGCVQRPWCDMGRETGWPEDEEAGRMACPEQVVPYLQSTPVRGSDARVRS